MKYFFWLEEIIIGIRKILLVQMLGILQMQQSFQGEVREFFKGRFKSFDMVTQKRLHYLWWRTLKHQSRTYHFTYLSVLQHCLPCIIHICTKILSKLQKIATEHESIFRVRPFQKPNMHQKNKIPYFMFHI